jgi:hypothetical protein
VARFYDGGKAYCHLGGNSILGRFFSGGKDGPGMVFPRGNSVLGPSFRGESLTRARFSGGKVYPTTPALMSEKFSNWMLDKQTTHII